MIKVGITGGIGSGKTTFCKELEKLGAYVVYADDLAKHLMQEDAELREKITQAFGKSAYQEGKLNKKYLAEEAFEKERVNELNAIVHPVLFGRIKTLAIQKEKDGIRIFAKEAAILLSNGRPEMLDYVILLLSGEENRTQRVMKRDNAEKDHIISRINKQPDFESLTHLCDFIVVNDGTIEELRFKANEIYQAIIDLE